MRKRSYSLGQTVKAKQGVEAAPIPQLIAFFIMKRNVRALPIIRKGLAQALNIVNVVAVVVLYVGTDSLCHAPCY